MADEQRTPDVFKGFSAKIDDVRDDYTLVVRINTDEVDRDREVVFPDGMKQGRYQSNPMVLWHHDYGPDTLPIGRNLWVKPSGKRNGHSTSLVAATRFDEKQEFARDVFRLYKEGYMSAWSIGAGEVERAKLTDDEIRKNPQWAGAEAIWRSWELLEYSAVKVPANPGTETMRGGMALDYTKIKGLVSPNTIEVLGITPEHGEESEVPPAAPSIKRIVVVTQPPRVVVAPPQVRKQPKSMEQMVREEIARRLGAV